jgi:uncharacterized protein (UPF0332 family)
MSERAAQLIEGAERAIASAHRELDAEDTEAAAERACVAMLRLAKACLDVDGLAPGPTQAVCIAYGSQFGRSGRMYSAYHRWLLDAADLRKASSGDLNLPVDLASIATAVERAEIFRDAVVRFVEHNP